MTDLIKEYNSYLSQLEMVLHPNLLNAFIKIHNEILKAEIEQAKSFKPSKEWVELKRTITEMNSKEKSFQDLYMRQIKKQIVTLPNDKGWQTLKNKFKNEKK